MRRQYKAAQESGRRGRRSGEEKGAATFILGKPRSQRLTELFCESGGGVGGGEEGGGGED